MPWIAATNYAVFVLMVGHLDDKENLLPFGLLALISFPVTIITWILGAMG